MSKTIKSYLALASLAAVLCMAMPQEATASHFRFAHHTWKHISGNTVEFNLREAWRLNTGSVYISFGDGTSYFGSNRVSQPQDLAGLTYDIHQATVQHTYPNAGPFTTSNSSCCRIFEVNNASSASFQVSADVDLRNGQKGSSVASIPPILQMTQGPNSVVLAVADPDGGPITCRMATSAESFVTSVASVSSGTLSVSSGCVLSWDASAAAHASKWAAQVAIFEGGLRTALDFIIEINAGLVNNDPPSCTLNGATSNTVSVGTPFSISATGTDPEAGNLRINHLGLPAGATLTPANGTTVASPATATFNWTPSVSGTVAVTLTFTDDSHQACQSSFAINVPANTPPQADAGADQIVEQEGPAGSNVTLNGSASSDADGDALSYNWSGPFGTATGATPSVLIPAGTHTVTLVVNDGSVNSAPATMQVTVQDTIAPAIVTSNASIEATGPSTPYDVSGDGSATDAVGVVSLTNDSLGTFPVGVTTVTWTAVDAAGNTSTATQTVTVVDTTAPVITMSACLDKLWPPNHKMVLASTVSVSDTADPNVAVTITVTSNQAIQGKGAGHTAPDWEVIDGNVYLRAERSGHDSDRVYTITVTATDASGNASTAVCETIVPHDQGEKSKKHEKSKKQEKSKKKSRK